LNSTSEGTVSFIRGSDELLDEIADKGIKIGMHLEYEPNENENQYSIIVDGTEMEISVEMANNIFIRV
jgi:DtxR family Mn-dependent transcriptional regulator